MRCSNCGALNSMDDNFCRRCGATLRNVRLPAARNGSNLPAVSRGGSSVLPAVAQGAAIFALSAAFPILVRVLGSRVVRLPLVLARPLLRLPKLSTKKARLPARRDEPEDEPGVIYAFRETVFIKKIPLRR